MKKPFIKVGERVRFIGTGKHRRGDWPEGKWLEYGVIGTVTEYHPEQPTVIVKGERFEALPPYAVVTWDLGGAATSVIDPEDEGKRWERIMEQSSSRSVPQVTKRESSSYSKKEGLDTFTLGKELAAYVPGFKVEVIELPGKSLAFATSAGEIDDKKKKILIKVWPDATRQHALAILAHEYSHIQKGTTIIEKGLTEPEVWQRGETTASQWGVLDAYLKLATDLVEYYERTGSYPKITSGIRSWLAKRASRKRWERIEGSQPRAVPQTSYRKGDDLLKYYKVPPSAF